MTQRDATSGRAIVQPREFVALAEANRLIIPAITSPTISSINAAEMSTMPTLLCDKFADLNTENVVPILVELRLAPAANASMAEYP